MGVLTVQMLLSNIKIINKIKDLKVVIIKTGIFMSLAAYWGVILVGTFITFNSVSYTHLTLPTILRV